MHSNNINDMKELDDFPLTSNMIIVVFFLFDSFLIPFVGSIIAPLVTEIVGEDADHLSNLSCP